MKHITVRFRAPPSLQPDQALLDEIRGCTRALYKQQLKIIMDFPEKVTQFTISAADVSVCPVDEPASQENTVSRFRNTYGNGIAPSDFIVYFVVMPVYHGFTPTTSADIFIAINHLDCRWVLAHELGHVLGCGDQTGEHVPDDHLAMYPWPCDIANPPPEFPVAAKSVYQKNNKYIH